jgi:hypothetical protein
MSGRQIIANITRRDGGTWADEAGYGRDWSNRPWYLQALALDGEVAVSDIYRSSATSDFCFTASVVVKNHAGERIGVLAADVNFQTLVAAHVEQQRATVKRREAPAVPSRPAVLLFPPRAAVSDTPAPEFAALERAYSESWR